MYDIRDNKGAALAFVVVVMVVVFLLVTGLVVATQAENKHSLYQSDAVNAYYVARAGAQAVAMEMTNMNPDLLDEFVSNPLTASANGILNGVGDVDVVVTNSGIDYRVVSTGTYNGHQANVAIMMSYSDQYIFNYAAYSWEDMGNDNPNGSIGIGPVYGNLASRGNIYIKPSDIGPDTYITQKELHFPMDEANVTESDYTLTVFPGGDMTLNNSARFVDLDMGNNEDLIINTGDAEYDKMEPGGSFTMSNVGSGSGDWIVIYLEGDCEIQGDIDINGNKNCMIIVDDILEIGGGMNINTSGDVEIHVIDDVTSDTDTPPEVEVEYELELSGNILYGDSSGSYTFDNTPSYLDFVGVDPYKLIIYVHEDKHSGDENGVRFDGNLDFLGYIFAPTGQVYFKNGSTNIYGGVYANTIDFDAEPSIIQPEDVVSDKSLYKAMEIDYWE